jgi:hypothetical protein
MEALTISGLVVFLVAMLAPFGALIWALFDLGRRPTPTKGLIKIMVAVLIVWFALSLAIGMVFALVGVLIGVVGIMDLSIRRRRWESESTKQEKRRPAWSGSGLVARPHRELEIIAGG